MTLTGKCACGAVKYKVLDADDPKGVHACYCDTCRAWSGSGVFFCFTVDDVDFGDTTNDVAVWKSSEWAERGFCKKCGSCLFYKLTGDDDAKGKYHVAAGTLDDWKDLKFDTEYFIDSKPKAFSFEGKRDTTMTKAEVEAYFASLSTKDE